MGANCESMHPQQQSHEKQFATDCTITAALVGNVTVALHSLTIPKSFIYLFIFLNYT